MFAYIFPLVILLAAAYFIFALSWITHIHNRYNKLIHEPWGVAINNHDWEASSFLGDEACYALTLYQINNPLTWLKKWNEPIGIQKWEALNGK